MNVTETYVYGGRQGRASQRDTVAGTGESFTQSFGYTPLGLPNSVLPARTHAACQDAAPVFVDVSAAHPNRPEIEAIYGREITSGCVASPPQYCPDSFLTRRQMPPFLIKAVSGKDQAPVGAQALSTGPAFT